MTTTPISVTPLYGHVSQETAHVDLDYPYGSRLRCMRRIWLETANKGVKRDQTRVMSQTSNPTRPDTVWNKAHAGNYHDLVVLIKAGDTGYVSCSVLHAYSDVLDYVAMEALFTSDTPEDVLKRFKTMKTLHRVYNKVSWDKYEAEVAATPTK